MRSTPKSLATATAVAAALALASGVAHSAGALHQCKGDGGKLVFTNVDVDRSACKQSFSEPVRKGSKPAAASSGKSAAATTGKRKSYPKVSAATQRKRDETRHQILVRELETEIKMARAFTARIEEGDLEPEELQILERNRENHRLNILALNKEIDAIR